MPHELVAGALDTTIVPLMTEWLLPTDGSGAEPLSRVATDRHFSHESNVLCADALVHWQDEPTEAPLPATAGATHASALLHSAPAAAPEANLPLPSPPPPAAFVLPRPPRRGETWSRAVWARDDNLPVWLEESSLLPDALDADADHGVLLPDLDITAGRITLGLNDLSWTASDAPTIVFILHDFLDGNGERWSPLVFATQLPVFGLHTPPGLLMQFNTAASLGHAAPPHANAARFAMQYYEAVRACLPPDGANCVIVGYEHTVALATELAMQLRLRSSDGGHHARHVVSLLVQPPEHDLEAKVCAPLSSPAYQALYARMACASASSPPPWSTFAQLLASAGAFDEQLEVLAAHRPPGVPRATWDAEVDHDVRDTVTLFQLAEARLPWSVTPGHVVLMHAIRAHEVNDRPRLQRTSSLARILRAGRDMAQTQRAMEDDAATLAFATAEAGIEMEP